MIDVMELFPGDRVIFKRTGEVLTVKHVEIDDEDIYMEEGELVVDGDRYPYFYPDELEYADSPDELSVPSDSKLLDFLGGRTDGSV